MSEGLDPVSAPDPTPPPAEPTPDPTPPVEPTPDPPPPAAAQDYRASLPDGLGQHPALERLESVEALVREHVNLQKVLGGAKMPRPDENWGKAEWDRFFNDLGRPSEAAGYDLSEVTMPEGLPVDEGWRDDALTKAHELGLTQKQAQGMLAWYFENAGQRFHQAQADAESAQLEGLKGLKTAWGRAYEQKLAQADRALIQLTGGKEAAQALADEVLADGRKLSTHPGFIQMLAAVGEIDTEHGLFGEDRVAGHIYTPAEAEKELRKLEGDEEFLKKLMDPNHPEHKDAAQKRSDLIRMIREPQPIR